VANKTRDVKKIGALTQHWRKEMLNARGEGGNALASLTMRKTLKGKKVEYSLV